MGLISLLLLFLMNLVVLNPMGLILLSGTTKAWPIPLQNACCWSGFDLNRTIGPSPIQAQVAVQRAAMASMYLLRRHSILSTVDRRADGDDQVGRRCAIRCTAALATTRELKFDRCLSSGRRPTATRNTPSCARPTAIAFVPDRPKITRTHRDDRRAGSANV